MVADLTSVCKSDKLHFHKKQLNQDKGRHLKNVLTASFQQKKQFSFVSFHLAFGMQGRPWAVFIVFGQKFQLLFAQLLGMANET